MKVVHENHFQRRVLELCSLFLECKPQVVNKPCRNSNIDSAPERQTRKKGEEQKCMDHFTADQKVVLVCFDV